MVHSIGFAREHDFKFLDALRLAGSQEGIYRYVDPSQSYIVDGENSLTHKIGDLVRCIAQVPFVPLQLTSCPFPMVSRQTNARQFWVKMNFVSSATVTLQVDDKQFELPVECVTGTRHHKEEWYAHTIDRLASDFAEYVKRTEQKRPFDFLLPLWKELLLHRGHSLLQQVAMHSKNEQRLQEILLALEEGKLDSKQALDLQFESKEDRKKKIAVAFTKPPEKVPFVASSRSWQILTIAPPPMTTLSQLSSSQLEAKCRSEPFDLSRVAETAFLGRSQALSILLEKRGDIPIPNEYLLFPVKRGYWRCFELLYYEGNLRLPSSVDPQDLLRTFLSQHAWRSADLIIRLQIARIDDALVSSCPDVEILKWLCDYSKRQVSWSEAIAQGLVVSCKPS